MNKHNSEACDDENGNCKVCGHPFDPHVVIAYDGDDLAKAEKCVVRLQIVTVSNAKFRS
jgi:hypothetical protein